MTLMRVSSRDNDRIALLLDGGFLRKVLRQDRRDQIITPSDVVDACQGILDNERLKNGVIYRIFYYDAMPFEGVLQNPMDGYRQNFKTTDQYVENRDLINGLELQPDFAVRRGTLLSQGWKIKKNAVKALMLTKRQIEPKDLTPDFKQKGVDIRIGLDMARIALKRLVDILVLVTGDSDFVPVMRFARTEGLKVYLATFGRPIRPEMRAHADCVLS